MQGYCRPLYKQLSLFIAGMLRTCVNRSVQILRTSSNFLSVCVLWTHVCTASFLCVISFGIADLCTNSQFFFVFFHYGVLRPMYKSTFPSVLCCRLMYAQLLFFVLFYQFWYCWSMYKQFFFQYGVLRPMCKSTFRCLSKGVVELYINIFFVFNIIGGAVGL